MLHGDIMKDKHDSQTIDLLKEPPKTGAERQKAYRARLKAENGKRLDYQISEDLYAKLSLISSHCNESKKAVLERLIETEFVRIANCEDFDINKFNA